MKVYIVYISGKTWVEIGNVYDNLEEANKSAMQLQDMFGLSMTSAMVVEREVMQSCVKSELT